MECVTVSTEVLYPIIKPTKKYKTVYIIDFWREVKKRWLVFGVLAAVLAAIISPWMGARSGPLHPEHTSFIPLSYIYFTAGRRGMTLPTTRIVVLVALLVTIAVPTATLLVVYALRGVDFAMAKVLLSWSSREPCGWLALSVARDGSLGPLLIVGWVTALVMSPLHTALLCGRATIPPLGNVLSTVLTTVMPFLIGALRRSADDQGITALKNGATSMVEATAPNSLMGPKFETPQSWGTIANKNGLLKSCVEVIIDKINAWGDMKRKLWGKVGIQKGMDAEKTIMEAQGETGTNISSILSLWAKEGNKKETSSDNQKERIQGKTGVQETRRDLLRSENIRTYQEVMTKCCMLWLLYCECCEKLDGVGGGAAAGDVVSALVGVTCATSASAFVGIALAKATRGFGAGREGRVSWRTLVAAALPKCCEPGWRISSQCTATGLARLPQVLLPPAQALMLAALITDDDDDDRSSTCWVMNYGVTNESQCAAFIRSSDDDDRSSKC